MKDGRKSPAADGREVMKSASSYAESKYAEALARYRSQKIKLIKIGGMLVFMSIVMVFATRSWFTMSREVDGTGASMTAEGTLFTIQEMSSPFVAGIYDDTTNSGTYVRNLLLSKASKEPDVITWTITEEKNIGNGSAPGYSSGISPGSSGELQFKFSPNGSVNAKLTFDLCAYSVGLNAYGDEDKSTIALIDENGTAEGKLAKNLLNGHILLFENYNSNTGKYSGLISTDDFQRIMNKTYTQETTESVYWVWVETLAELVLDDTKDAHKRNLRGKKSLCVNRSEIIKLLKNNPTWFFLDSENPDKTWTEFTSGTSDEAVADIINNNYSVYSAYYNEADQCIGTNVAYLLLDMVAEGTAASVP